MATTQSTIQVDGQAVLNLVNSFLPVLENYIPAVQQNSQLVTLGTSAASSLLTLIGTIPVGTGGITQAQQAAMLSKVYAILAGSELSNPEWKIQT